MIKLDLTGAEIDLLRIDARLHAPDVQKVTIAPTTDMTLAKISGYLVDDVKLLISWLEHGGPLPEPFPVTTWVAVANALERSGREEQARRLRYRATDHFLWNTGSVWLKIWAGIKKVTIGHGYYPSRALTGILVLLALAFATVWTNAEYFVPTALAVADDGTVTVASGVSSNGYPGFWSFLYAFDVVLSPVASGQTEAWRVAGNQALALWIAGLKLGAYALLGLFVTGITGVVSRR